MMKYQIITETIIGMEYKNEFFGLIDTLNEVLEISACDNVVSTEVVCCDTGEVLVIIEQRKIQYLALKTIYEILYRG